MSKLVPLFLGGSLAAIALFFGLVVWRLVHLPYTEQPAANQRVAPTHPAATPRQEIVEMEAGSGEHIRTAPAPLLGSGEETPPSDAGRKEPADTPPCLPKVLTGDQVVEQRLRASEDELRDQLRVIPELRLLSDPDVKNVREAEREAQKHLRETIIAERESARVAANAANAKVDAIRRFLNTNRINRANPEANRAEQIASSFARTAQSAFNNANCACWTVIPREQEKIGYEFSLRLHQTLKRSAAQAGLMLGSGPSCQLPQSTAAQVAKLSKDLRDAGFVIAPGTPFVSRVNTMEKMKEFQTWCDRHVLEGLSGAVPTLTQMLQIEDEATRLLLVRELTRTPSKSATVELAVRAVVDLSPEVRRAALAGLEQRSSPQYVPILLRGLRYPWPPVADHAAVALRTLKPQEAVAPLVDLLDLPSPSAPVLDAKTNRYTVRELVRLNHLRNCLLCHAPSANKEDGLVRGPIPTPGQPLPVLYCTAQSLDFVRADMTFLRQDFSLMLSDKNAAPWPSEQRYDFVTRLRTVPPNEVAHLPASSANYPQRDAVLYALRGLTGKDGGDSSARWRELLGLAAEKPRGEPKSPALEKIAVPTINTDRPR